MNIRRPAMPDAARVYDLTKKTPCAGPARPGTVPAAETKPGAFVVIGDQENTVGNEVVKIFSDKKELVFEYDAKTGKARIFVRSGDLDLMTGKGDINLNAAGNIKFNAENIEVTGRSGISLGVSRLPGDDSGASIALDPRKVNISGPEMRISAGRGSLFFTELRYAGEKIYGTAGHVRIMARRIETAAKTIFEKADNVYRKVKELSQLQAGRKRVLVDDTFYVKSKRSVMKSDKNFKVKSDKIHLG